MPATTPAQDAQAHDLRQSGMSFATIAAALGCTPQQAAHAVTRHARTNGLADPVRRRSDREARTYARRAGIAFDPDTIVAAVESAAAHRNDGSIIPLRTFGIEIEFHANGNAPSAITAALVAAGIDAVDENYNHQTRSHWKHIYDGSSDRELVSPVLSGPEGLAQVRTVMRVLREMGCSVTAQDGMHVHVYVGDQRAVTVADVFGFYALRQTTVFDRLVSSGRRDRGRRSNWCQGVNADDYRRTMTYARRGTVQAIHGRYVTCNLLPFSRQGTVEFRQHQGSLNGRKACDWVELVLALTQFVIDGHTSDDYTVNGTLRALRAARLLTRNTAMRLARKARDYGFTEADDEAVGADVPEMIAAPPEAVAEVVEATDGAVAFDGCNCPICTEAVRRGATTIGV